MKNLAPAVVLGLCCAGFAPGQAVLNLSHDLAGVKNVTVTDNIVESTNGPGIRTRTYRADGGWHYG
jgi:hypothetical protein